MRSGSRPSRSLGPPRQGPREHGPEGGLITRAGVVPACKARLSLQQSCLARGIVGRARARGRARNRARAPARPVSILTRICSLAHENGPEGGLIARVRESVPARPRHDRPSLASAVLPGAHRVSRPRASMQPFIRPRLPLILLPPPTSSFLPPPHPPSPLSPRSPTPSSPPTSAPTATGT